METTDGKEITIRKTANPEMTPYAYSVYVGEIRIAGGRTGAEAREIAQGMTRPITEAWKTEMERSW